MVNPTLPHAAFGTASGKRAKHGCPRPAPCGAALEEQMTCREAARAYRQIAKELHRLQLDACAHISRRDNNQVFEIQFFFEAVADRIATRYPDADYPRLLK